ncbi:MAG: NAD(+)/NADH kinase [Chloroflexi bacterium]|nr:NAD(+)/NADH kinase [Chloroflexota bacterium]
MLKTVGLLFHPQVEASKILAGKMAEKLQELGLSTWVTSSWEEAEAYPHMADCDLLITLGGDGTILRAGHLAASRGVPILGVNFGRLGFLTEVEPQEALDVLPRLVSGDFRRDERHLLHAEAWRQEHLIYQAEGLNDAAIGRWGRAKVLRMQVLIDGIELGQYVADGVVIATPTGSTAYSLAAGGPIVYPGLQSLLVTPVAAHLARLRAIVVPLESRIEIIIDTHYDAQLTVDGLTDVVLTNKDRVVVTTSPKTVEFVRFGPENQFYADLHERLK